jgi:Phytanoyl-CoA dioxygenase (PhyH)
MTEPLPWLDELDRAGFAPLPGVLTAADCTTVARDLTAALAGSGDDPAAIRHGGGGVYAARNVLDLWPAAADVWRTPALTHALATALGPRFGLVRALFFDKPPERTWALPWHKDLTVAVREHRPNLGPFAKPTVKAGVAHLEAPAEILAAMLAVRLHLDDVTAENGPLQIIPGSHRDGKRLVFGAMPPHTVFARAGDALLMRPLLTHASGRSQPGTIRHRRILHLEFAAGSDLPAGFAWHTFRPGCRSMNPAEV